MSRNYLSEFSREEIKIGEEDEEIVSLNKRTPTEETISYQRTLLKRANEEIEGLKQDREQRKSFSKWIFIFTCIYMASSLSVVCLCGLSIMQLSDKILFTLLSSTLAEVTEPNTAFCSVRTMPMPDSPKKHTNSELPNATVTTGPAIPPTRSMPLAGFLQSN